MASYPPPPHFYKLYAPEPEDAAARASWTPPPAAPPPIVGAYTVFGGGHTVRRRSGSIRVLGSSSPSRAFPLPPTAIERSDAPPLLAPPSRAPQSETVDPPFEQSKLYRGDGPGADLRAELIRLNRDILERFIALVGDLVATPSACDRRVEELSLLFNNVHHLLNAIRPSQARAALEHVLEEQAKQKRTQLENLRRDRERAENAVDAPPRELADAVNEALRDAEAEAEARESAMAE